MLTKRQREVLAFLEKQVQESGIMPGAQLAASRFL
jgi:SOS-response transcriptional repressor LexA